MENVSLDLCSLAKNGDRFVEAGKRVSLVTGSWPLESDMGVD